jgi:hypothetical protein
MLTIQAPIPLMVPDSATHNGVGSFEKKISRSNVFLANSPGKDVYADDGGNRDRAEFCQYRQFALDFAVSLVSGPSIPALGDVVAAIDAGLAR